MCSVVGCESSRRGAPRFLLPEDPERRLQWVQFLLEVNGMQLKESSWTDIAVCSEHFPGESFVGAGQLSPAAVPSVSIKQEPEEAAWSPDDTMTNIFSVEDVLKLLVDGNSSDVEQLEEGDDEEEEDEKWTQTAVWTHENSHSDEEDSQNETLDRMSAEVEGPTTQQVGKKEHQWTRDDFVPPDVKFHENVPEDSKERFHWTPYMYFKDFVTDEMIQEIAEQTNLYSVQKEGYPVNTTTEEIEKLLGMYLHMGLVQMPSVRAYWELETKHSAVSDAMPRGRFAKLLTLIHFRDNLGVSDDADADKLWKLRPWLQKLRARFLSVPPEECHAVEKVTVPFKGKSHQRVCMPAKANGCGFKMWARAGQSGFLYDFDICQKEDHPDQENVAGDVLLKMTSTLPSGENHKVFAGNYLTSVPSVEQLKERGIYYAGRVRMSRIKGCDLMEERRMRKKGRGCVDFKVNQDKIVVVRWYDNKAVNLLSSFVGIEPVGSVRRWDRKSKTRTTVPRPAVVEAYNKVIGGVGFIDMLSALYKFSFRSRRWYMYIWWHTVTLAVVNAWNLFRRDQKKWKPWQKPTPLRRFQASVGTSLTSAGKGKIQCGGPASSPKEGSPPRKRRRSSVPPDVRKDGVDHSPVWEARQRCKNCRGNRFTHVYCEKCKVHLCLNKYRNCFQEYHNAE